MYGIKHPIRKPMKKSIRPYLPVLVLLLLLSHPKLSFRGAQAGLLLWFNVVLPTLLPFMLCSSLLISWGGAELLSRPLLPFFSFLGLSPAGGYCLLTGLLCGYPMGPKTTADLLSRRQITDAEANELLAVSACPSPMFVAGYLQPRLPQEIPFLFVVTALYLPVLLTGIYFHRKKLCSQEQRRQLSPKTETWKEEASFDQILMNSLELMVKIGGFLMLYSILAVFLMAIPDRLLPSGFKAVLLSLPEMTTGIDFISKTVSGLPEAVLILFSAAFGGLSGVSQTRTVIKNAGLSIRHYLRWKLIHASLSSIILILLSSLQQLLVTLPPAP